MNCRECNRRVTVTRTIQALAMLASTKVHISVWPEVSPGQPSRRSSGVLPCKKVFEGNKADSGTCNDLVGPALRVRLPHL